MPYGKDGRSFIVDAIEDDIAAIAEADGPLPEFGIQTFDRSAGAWLVGQYSRAGSYCMYGTACSVNISRGKEAV